MFIKHNNSFLNINKAFIITLISISCYHLSSQYLHFPSCVFFSCHYQFVQIRIQTSCTCYIWLTFHIFFNLFIPFLFIYFLLPLYFTCWKKSSDLSCKVSYILGFCFSIPVVVFNWLTFRFQPSSDSGSTFVQENLMVTVSFLLHHIRS